MAHLRHIVEIHHSGRKLGLCIHAGALVNVCVCVCVCVCMCMCVCECE